MNLSTIKPNPPAIKNHPVHQTIATRVAGLLLMGSLAGLQATVLDNFSGVRTGWTDTLNGGAISQAGGQLTVATAPSAGALTSSLKTSTSFANVAGNTLELRVDVNGVTPGNGDANAMAVVGWVPAGGALAANGYSFYAGAGGAKIMKGGSVLYSINFVNSYGTNVQNTNVTLALRMTPSGSGVTLDARLYQQTGAVVGQNFTCLFEQTVTDPSGLIGSPGYAALGVFNQASASGASASFANLQDFVLVDTVLDDFSVDNNLAGWQTFVNPSAVPGVTSSVTEYPPSGGNPGYVECIAGLNTPAALAGAFYAGQTFQVVDGSRLEFSVDFDNLGNDELNGGGGSYSVLGYLPVASESAVFALNAYHIAHDLHQSDYLVAGKNYNGWWTTGPDNLPVMNCRYTLIMTGEGVNERIEARLEDLSYDINDPNRVAFQNVMVDTPASDFSGDGATWSPAHPGPYLNFNGAFAIFTFGSGPCYEADVVFRNARVNQSIAGASPPAVLNLSPADGANFVASSNSVSFQVNDAVGIAAANISLTLNGVTYTSASPGVTVTGTAKAQVFTLKGVLAPDVNYVGTIEAVNGQQLSATVPIRFDTFLNAYVVESEDFNFSSDGVTGGSFIDNPKVITDDYLNQPGVTDPRAYNGMAGIPGVDYHNSQDSSDAPWTDFVQDINHVFRWNDPVQTTYSADFVRAAYASLGGNANGYYEVDVENIHDGDWQNYTHTYPAGTYAAYLRQEQYLLPESLVTLERVTSDRTETNQTTTLLGAFMGSPNGSGPHFNVALTDAAGTPVVVRFSGATDTLRVNNRVTGNASTSTGVIQQNYLALAPVPDPGKLRPIVAVVSPLAGQTVGSASPPTYADIANRDTSVNASSVQLTINGIAVPSTNTPNAGGVQVTWSISVLPPAATFTNTLSFKDSDGTNQSVSWTYSYPFLSASNSLPIGSLQARGFQTRTAMSLNGGANLDNSLSRALQQLAVPPQIPVDLVATSIVSELNWNVDGSPTNVPGLCPGNQINIAVEALAYLELKAGAHRFRISTDDQSGLYSGSTPWDTSGTALFVAPGDTAYQTFDFVVGADGLYPFQCIWEQTGGGAILQLAAVDPDGVNADALIGDPSEPPGVVDAYYPIVCASTASFGQPFTVDPTATAGLTTLTTSPVTGDCGTVVNDMVSGGSGTFTLPVSGAERYFRILAPRPTTITSIRHVGSNVVLTYKLE